MSEESPYIPRKPGDPITAEDWNEVQVGVKQDIQAKIGAAIDGLESVPKSDDAVKFGGKTPDEYAQAIVDRVLYELPKRTGYLPVYKKLKVGEQSVVEHKLGACPLTDLYQLDYFGVVCSEDDQVFLSLTNFFLYHESESKIRFAGSPPSPPLSVPVEPPEGQPYRIPFETMLKLYNVEYTDASSLGDVETEFWRAFFSAPNDRFDDDQYCHSPWFDRCCREQRPVRQLKSRRDWDELYFQMRPRKVTPLVELRAQTDENTEDTPNGRAPGEPTLRGLVRVDHFDFERLGLTLLGGDEDVTLQLSPDFDHAPFIDPAVVPTQPSADTLMLMLLLKV